MSNRSVSPPMSHSAAYYEHHQSSNTSSPAQFQPRPHPLTRPPLAHVSHKLSPAPSRREDGTYVKTSVSSGTSRSSGTIDYKTYPPVQPYKFGSHAERGLMDRSPTSQSSGHGRSRITGSIIGRPEMVEDHSAVVRYINHDDEDGEPEEKDHAIWILFWLSCLDPFHSIFSCLFSIITLFGLILISPFRLCSKSESFSITLIRTVAPVLRNHLQSIYASSVKKAHTFDFSPTALILVHLAAPIFSLGLAFFAWIAAVFWLFALIMGNPDGTERGDDGRATVLGARNYLEKFLLCALRNRP